MPKFPLTVNGKTLQVQEFTDGAERLILIGERSYRIWPLESGECYTMVTVRKTKRSLKGSPEDVIQAIGQIHETYRMYDDQARRAKETAQKARDAALHKIVESVFQS